MEKSRYMKLITAFAVITLICIAAAACLYLFAGPDGWISVQPSHYNSTSPPPADAVILIPTEQDYQQYPHLKALMEKPGSGFPISDNLIVRMKQGDSVVSGQEAGELLGKYGYAGDGYIFSQKRYYKMVLVVT